MRRKNEQIKQVEENTVIMGNAQASINIVNGLYEDLSKAGVLHQARSESSVLLNELRTGLAECKNLMSLIIKTHDPDYEKILCDRLNSAMKKLDSAHDKVYEKYSDAIADMQIKQIEAEKLKKAGSQSPESPASSVGYSGSDPETPTSTLPKLGK